MSPRHAAWPAWPAISTIVPPLFSFSLSPLSSYQSSRFRISHRCLCLPIVYRPRVPFPHLSTLRFSTGESVFLRRVVSCLS